MTTITLEELEEAFTIHDKNGDGILTKEEYEELVKGFNIDNNLTFDNEFYTFDDFRELVDIYINTNIGPIDVEAAFKTFETYQDGQVDVKEFLNIMEAHGDILSYDELQELMREFIDDGKIKIQDIIKLTESV